MSSFAPSCWSSSFCSCGVRAASPRLITYLVEGTGEFEGNVLIFADRRAGVFPDVKGFIGGNAERNSSRKFPFGHFLPVHAQGG